MLPLVRHQVARPQQLQRVEGLVEDLRAVSGVGVLTETRELVVGGAQADTQSKASCGEPVERDRLACHHRHPPPRQRRDHRPEDDPFGGHRNCRECHPRIDHRLPRLASNQVIPQEEAVPPGSLGIAGERSESGRVGEVAAVGHTESELGHRGVARR